MESPEVPLEKTQDHINEHAREAEEKWVLGVAVSTAILAAVAAIASLLAGQHINEGMISQLRASDQWAFYQAKGIKANVLEAKMELLEAEGKTPAAADAAKAAKYAEEQEDISKEAKALEAESTAHLARHEKFSSAVTLFQIAIAVSAISILTQRRRFWYVGLAFGAGGVVFLALALL
ncbi:MAG TPA: DUF4337 domain-containing protein [Chthoniobacteraceae bacterium]|jgi:hypothetical protein|nr:DUF4337 domain-containing protein [Chthoniobacteraceae bacterium]